MHLNKLDRPKVNSELFICKTTKFLILNIMSILVYCFKIFKLSILFDYKIVLTYPIYTRIKVFFSLYFIF